VKILEVLEEILVSPKNRLGKRQRSTVWEAVQKTIILKYRNTSNNRNEVKWRHLYRSYTTL